MKTFNYIFSGLFVVCALLQINDPDPYLWIPIYGYVALVCFLNARGKYDSFAHIGTLIFCFLFGLKLFFARDGVMAWFNQHEAESLVQSMKATKPWIEQSREFGGLLIISIVISINMVINKKSRS
ncbi:MAG: hypothetical protein RL394_346 [Bacteroidota bacterium]|jgi:hypothetical protein